MKKFIYIVFLGILLLASCGEVEPIDVSVESSAEFSVESSFFIESSESSIIPEESSCSEESVVSSLPPSEAPEESEESSEEESSVEESSADEIVPEDSSAEESSIETSSEDISEETSSEESRPDEEILIADHIVTNLPADKAQSLLEKIEYVASEGKDVSIYYLDTETGYYFYRNIEEKYPSASVIKAFYCQYLLVTGVDLKQKIQLTETPKTSSSKKLTKDAIGTWFTVEELIKYSIRNSDNMAYYLLFTTFGRSGFNDYIRSLGLDEPYLYSIEYTTLGAESAALCMKEIYRYAKKTGNTFLVDHLRNTTHKKQIDAGTETSIAHKYGLQDGKNLGYHDVAIVFTEEPYILAIFTRENGYESEANKVFREVASLVEELHISLH